MNRFGLALGVALIAATAGGSSAQGPVRRNATAAQAGTPVDGKAVVAEVRRLIAANYVLAEVRPRLDAALAAGLAAGRYDVSDPSTLAERLNADMAAVAHDKHLGIRFDPDQARLIGAREGEGPQDGAAFERQALRRNHGVSEMKMLPGHIRYVAIDGFMWTGPKSAAAYELAMRFLKDGDAAIIDLRRNGGGSPDAVQYVISHFLPPNTPIVTFHMGASQVDRL
jgi:hypothetical protein